MRALRALVCAVFCASLVVLSACASNRPTGTHVSQREREAVVTVLDVDVPNRLVTVRTASGGPLTVYVDKANTAFPQVAVGDQVRVRYVESMALRLAKPGTTPAEVSMKEETTRPQAGQPRGETATEVTATVRIETVNADGSVVTFTGPRGRRSLEIRDAATRDYVRQLKPGDTVEATYREALALSLDKVGR